MTPELVELVVELPVEDSTPEVVYPVISYSETEPVTEAPKVAVIVSAPDVDARAYQM